MQEIRLTYRIASHFSYKSFEDLYNYEEVTELKTNDFMELVDKVKDIITDIKNQSYNNCYSAVHIYVYVEEDQFNEDFVEYLEDKEIYFQDLYSEEWHNGLTHHECWWKEVIL